MTGTNSLSHDHPQSFPRDEFGHVNDPTQPSQQQVRGGQDGDNGAFDSDEYSAAEAEFPLPIAFLEKRAKERTGR